MRVSIGVAASITAALVLATGSSALFAHDDGPQWSLATAVTEVNSAAPDGCPIESRDGLSLFIASTRSGTTGNDIWAADRASQAEPFSGLTKLASPVNGPTNDFCPTPIDGNYLLFVSERPGPETCNAGPGRGDMYVVRRNAAEGWGQPRHLGCVENGTGPNTNGAEFSPSLVNLGRETYLYFSSDVSGNQDIYRSRLDAKGQFGPPVPVTELNSEYDDRMPNVRSDGREIVFSSNRPLESGATNGFDVYASQRHHTGKRWSAPVNLGPNVNTAGNETRSSISWDGKRLYFGRDGDIFTSRRLR